MSVSNRFILSFVCVMTRKRLFTMFLHSALEEKEKNETLMGTCFIRWFIFGLFLGNLFSQHLGWINAGVFDLCCVEFYAQLVRQIDDDFNVDARHTVNQVHEMAFRRDSDMFYVLLDAILFGRKAVGVKISLQPLVLKKRFRSNLVKSKNSIAFLCQGFESLKTLVLH